MNRQVRQQTETAVQPLNIHLVYMRKQLLHVVVFRFILVSVWYNSGMLPTLLLHNRQNRRGFTLTEVLVVIGIFTILLIIILSNLGRNRMKTRDTIRVADMDTIRLALERYRATCGVFPATLELDAQNGRAGTCTSTFGDFIPEIPVAPTRAGTSLLIDEAVSLGSVFNGYFYAGLSTSLNGPCYDYHLGTELEFSENNGELTSGWLSKDHDYEAGEGAYDSQCNGSVADFGSLDSEVDDANGLYDFRSIDTH